KKLDWPTVGLSEKIPEAEFKYGKIFENSDKKLSITIYHVTKDDFDKYALACKNTDFVFEENTFKNYLVAYSEDGFKLTLNYEKQENSLRIRIEEGEPFVPNENGGSLDFMLDYLPQHFPD
ncbi:MAG: hypothetical protein IKJ50_04140, partial [Clostridia bacterium]|nr:hypothetical protein [Clostridia bacterium]